MSMRTDMAADPLLAGFAGDWNDPSGIAIDHSAIAYSRELLADHAAVDGKAKWVLHFTWAWMSMTNKDKSETTDLGGGIWPNAIDRKHVPDWAIGTSNGLPFACRLPPKMLAQYRRPTIFLSTGLGLTKYVLGEAK